MYWQDGIHEIPKQFVDMELEEVKKECGYIANHKAPEGVNHINMRVFEMLKEGNKVVADLELTRDDESKTINDKKSEEKTSKQ